jgi:hypothetical protein
MQEAAAEAALAKEQVARLQRELEALKVRLVAVQAGRMHPAARRENYLDTVGPIWTVQ